ncbi:hypothetical protein BC936DRAFT_145431 [Jimgerdemannia flammicorona]|uniref:Uncharacterized protein n=1 Tax=Jimgerdemannia flammicorona TaxID=994334 RepID=A0A433DAK4_9FUNG|nr:hypothetical protein BC936DRAFT_145431 [Jimgerdemannia flammicorona]
MLDYRFIAFMSHPCFIFMLGCRGQKALPILNAHLTIMRSELESLKLPLTEGEHMISFVALQNEPGRRQVQQLVSSQERRCEDQDSDGRTRIGQKTDLIIDLSTGPRFEGFVVRFREVYPRVVPKNLGYD